ncbi:sugar ABC transporter ATP-binding protein [Ilumatobacter fluminis]|uniref:sugar ABC transporter ATP-binding protein n=1 Tax=Ilumatobacter fluminis TaxID=467091 RepID=UPI001AAF9EA4|nr:sugar ABC transporter ATP-binding protein [Ilumatobacter fluminis]
MTRALDHVDLAFAPGEIVGLLGHNGAGKSTLLNVATGAVAPTEGLMRLDGDEVSIPSPSRSSELGITVIHQTPALAGNLSVLDNLFMSQPGMGRTAAERRTARDALAQVGGDDIDLREFVGNLPLGQRQLVDLARGLLHGDMKVLLLDEPTAALGKGETDSLHALIRRLAAGGTTVIYVSHRLPDIVEVCDRVVILRDGRVVGEQPVAGLSSAKLANDLAPGMQESAFEPGIPGDVIMEVRHPFPLEFRRGEVVGLFGVAGGEQFELFDALQGLDGHAEATLDGVEYRPRSPRAAIGLGVHTVVADRDTDGLIAGMGALDNVFAPWRGRRHEGRPVAPTLAARQQQYREICEALDIKGPGPESPMSAFSGGNRQKHLLAMWIYPVTPRLLLLAQPTQGVDVGAKADIRRVVRRAAADGMAVVVASAESDEIAGLCDRTYVLYGHQSAELARTDDFDAAMLDALLGLIPEKEAIA